MALHETATEQGLSKWGQRLRHLDLNRKTDDAVKPEQVFGVPDTGRMQTHVLLITPALARMALDMLPEHQRDLRPSVVKKFAAAMRDGKWLTTHQGLAFDANGHLIDGQHRCRAVIDANVSVRMTVSFGLEPEVFSVLDTGTARGVADALAAAGIVRGTVANTVSAAARLLTIYDRGGRMVSSGVGPWTYDRTMVCLERHPRLLEAAERVSGMPRHVPKAAMATMHTLGLERNEDLAEHMAVQLHYGEGLMRTDPVYHLREWCKSFESSRGNYRADGFAHRYSNAWNALRQGRQLQSLKGPVGEDPKYPRMI